MGAEASRKESRKSLPFAFIILSVSIGIASRVFQPPNAVPALTTRRVTAALCSPPPLAAARRERCRSSGGR